MKRTTAVITYIVTTSALFIGVLALVRLPAIIFVGVEDYALSLLFYVASILVVTTCAVYLFEFFMMKLGIIGLINMEYREIEYTIKWIKKDYDYLKGENTELRTEINYLRRKHEELRQRVDTLENGSKD